MDRWQRLREIDSSENPIPAEVVDAFPALDGDSAIKTLAGGLLNQSFHLRSSMDESADEFVLQRVNPVFSPAIHANIDAVTRHLETRNFPSLRLLPTQGGDLSLDLGDHGRWRLMTYLGGATITYLESPAQAYSAGHLAGRFHYALRDFDAPLVPMGIAMHDTPAYCEALQRALEIHEEHSFAREVEKLSNKVFAAFDALGAPPETPTRVIHGDLKLANLLFEGPAPPESERAFAIIDLDTLMKGPLWMELGDSWRSWCGNARDDRAEPQFEWAFFKASFEGFIAGHDAKLATTELESLVTAPERLSLELCLRFATDCLLESYFAWDRERYSRAAEHNWERALRQWKLAEHARAGRPRRASLVLAHV